MGETLRHALNVLAAVAPDWLRPLCPPEWPASYGHRFDNDRLPKEPAAREVLATRIGQDGFLLLAAAYGEGAPAWLRQLPAVETLRAVWVQNYYREGGELGAEPSLRWRSDAEIPRATYFIGSPYDPEARLGCKYTTYWVGYKVHLTETCDPELPHLITAVQTTPAPMADGDMTRVIHQELAARELSPQEHVVDTGYLDAAPLVSSRADFGIELVGPTRPDYRWQAWAGQGFAAYDFEIHFTEEYAVCPQGKRSAKWHTVRDRSGNPVM